MSDRDTVRVRFAPSPTGTPHIGNIRTALFNWLFARHHGGKFVLRIEDTDVARRVPGAVESILDALRWLGLQWDEGPEVDGPYGPYYQSLRLDLYQSLAERLVAEGKAYYCFCTQERLTEMRKEQEARKEPPGYDRLCRTLSEADVQACFEKGLKPVVRLKVPLEGETSFHDLIRGEITFANAVLDDLVLLKSDGYPTYHLANVIDDHYMNITHVMRAEEWIPSTPRHILLYKALGFEPPIFAHLPIILAPDRSKLSKRHGATDTGWYREQGYLPEAMVNYMALLGWAYDEKQEIFTIPELIEKFELGKVNPTGAVFSKDKLDWMNAYYINHVVGVEELAARCLPFLQNAGLVAPGSPADVREFPYLLSIVPLIKERMKLLSEVADLTDFFFLDDLHYDPLALVQKKMTPESTLAALESAEQALLPLRDWKEEALEGTLRPLAENLGLKPGQLFMTLRVAITGRTVSPGLFETMEVLGRQRTLLRVARAADALRNM
ncbi:MAG: glutamate--tRNA ligase [Chloroflexi bacterium]|nr:glutamate--tRNA ligase [Chloroflexota bacterium]